MYTKILKDEMKSQCLRFGICIGGKVSGDIHDTGRWLLKKDDVDSSYYTTLFTFSYVKMSLTKKVF